MQSSSECKFPILLGKGAGKNVSLTKKTCFCGGCGSGLIPEKDFMINGTRRYTKTYWKWISILPEFEKTRNDDFPLLCRKCVNRMSGIQTNKTVYGIDIDGESTEMKNAESKTGPIEDGEDMKIECGCCGKVKKVKSLENHRRMTPELWRDVLLIPEFEETRDKSKKDICKKCSSLCLEVEKKLLKPIQKPVPIATKEGIEKCGCCGCILTGSALTTHRVSTASHWKVILKIPEVSGTRNLSNPLICQSPCLRVINTYRKTGVLKFSSKKMPNLCNSERRDEIDDEEVHSILMESDSSKTVTKSNNEMYCGCCGCVLSYEETNKLKYETAKYWDTILKIDVVEKARSLQHKYICQSPCCMTIQLYHKSINGGLEGNKDKKMNDESHDVETESEIEYDQTTEPMSKIVDDSDQKGTLLQWKEVIGSHVRLFDGSKAEIVYVEYRMLKEKLILLIWVKDLITRQIRKFEETKIVEFLDQDL